MAGRGAVYGRKSRDADRAGQAPARELRQSVRIGHYNRLTLYTFSRDTVL